MRFLRLLLISAPLLSPLFVRASAPEGYALVWSDNFTGTTLDESKWFYRGEGNQRGDLGAYVSRDAVSVNNGLTISCYTDPATGTSYSGMISTQKSFLPTYGYFESRIRFNPSPGMAAAFWLQSPTNKDGAPASAGVEYDIMEGRGGKGGPNPFDVATHYSGYGDNQVSGVSNPPNSTALFTGYHTYGFLWTPTSTTFYVDGVVVWDGVDARISPQAPISHSPEYIILSTNIKSWAGTPPVGGYGALGAESNPSINVEYVHVYQVVPEPATYGCGSAVALLVLGVMRKKRRRLNRAV